MPRAVQLAHLAEPDGTLLVVASAMGQDRHPDWLLNLRAEPHARVLLPGRGIDVVAIELDRVEARPALARHRACHPPDAHLREAHDAGHPRRPPDGAMSTADDPPAEPSAAPAELDRASTRGRLMLAGITLGSGVAILDGSVVNVALRHHRAATSARRSRSCSGWSTATCWPSPRSCSSVARSATGSAGAGSTSSASPGSWWRPRCAPRPRRPAQLIALRVLQGVGRRAAHARRARRSSRRRSAPRTARPPSAPGPGSRASRRRSGRSLGGWLVDNASWRWIFAINVPLCVAVVALTRYAAPESRDPTVTGRFDVLGAALTVVALGAATYALTASTEAAAAVVVAGVGGGGGRRGGVRRRRAAHGIPTGSVRGCSGRASSPPPTA